VETETIFTVLVKIFIVIMLIIYLLVGIIMTKQIFLMNKAIKTKLAGFLNCAALIHMALILGVLAFAIVA